MNIAIRPQGHSARQERYVAPGDAFEQLIAIYETQKPQLNGTEETRSRLQELHLPTLDPAQIETFTKQDSQQHHAYPAFVNKIVQQSYDNGHSQFTIHNKKPHDWIGRELAGTTERPITLSIHGDNGDYCGYEIKNASIVIKGNNGNNCVNRCTNTKIAIAGNNGIECGSWSLNVNINIAGDNGQNCGCGTKNSHLTIAGNNGHDCGWYSSNTIFVIGGNNGDNCGYDSENMTITINGSIGLNYSFKPTYHTNNRRTYNQLKKHTLNAVYDARASFIEEMIARWRNR
jgi:glutamate synthase domain-containing protein 3